MPWAAWQRPAEIVLPPARYLDRMKIPGGVAAIAVSAVLTTALAACGGSDSKVSVDNLQKAADKMIAADTNSCPLSFDVNAALKKAGVSATATPSDGVNPRPLAAYAMSATNATRDSPLYQRGGAVINCGYTLSSGGSVNVTLFGVRTGGAIPIAAPQLSRDAQLELSALGTFIGQKFAPGKAAVTPNGGRAAIVKLNGSGGDLVLEATTVDDGSYEKDGPIVGEPLRKLTEALGKQVRV